MNAAHANACDAIVTDDAFGSAAGALLWETYAKLRRTVAIAARESVIVLGGFIGATSDGRMTTLGRGGSDLTTALLGAGISASEIQIWTDVDGILSCDPRVVSGGYRLRAVGCEEAAELARLGAEVLHPHTVEPAVRQGIPITIRNSRRPVIEGTYIGPAARHMGEELVASVYQELRRLASSYLRGGRPGHTLGATGLVHEAYLRLAGAGVDYQNRSHFFAVAATAMRRILVDHARHHHRQRRGGGGFARH